MYIIKYGDQNNKVIEKLSNYLRYFQKNYLIFSKILGGPSPPWSSSGSATGPILSPGLCQCTEALSPALQFVILVFHPLQSISSAFTIHLKIKRKEKKSMIISLFPFGCFQNQLMFKFNTAKCFFFFFFNILFQLCVYISIYILINHNDFIKISFDGSFYQLKYNDVLLLLLEGENVVVHTEYSFTLQKTR